MGKKKTRDALTYETLPELFTGICDAIREKTGGSDPIAHQSIPSEISNLPTGGDVEIAFNVGETVTSNVAITKTHTVENAGSLRLIAELTSELRFLTIKKNGTTVTGDQAFEMSTQRNSCRVVNSLSVAVGDVITVEVTAQALNGMFYAVGIITPTT